MIDQERSRVGNAAWTVDEIPYDAVDPAVMRDQTELFHIIAAASFVEITSDLYTRNLIEYYRGDDEIAAIAQKKTIEILASYYQSTADAIARRLILSAAVTTTAA